MNIGLFFGSFNPIHVGHLIICNYMLEFTDIEKIWMIVSPQNPFKQQETLADKDHRFKMVELALQESINIKACSIEFQLPVPSYTFDTLNIIKEKNPKETFHLIMGADNIVSINDWKESKKIIANYKIFVYPRLNAHQLKPSHENIKITKAPIVELSSSFIRKALKEGKNLQYLLPYKVYNYIITNNLYKD